MNSKRLDSAYRFASAAGIFFLVLSGIVRKLSDENNWGAFISILCFSICILFLWYALSISNDLKEMAEEEKFKAVYICPNCSEKKMKYEGRTYEGKESWVCTGCGCHGTPAS